MGAGDTPSMRRMREQVRGLDLILGINGALRLIGLGSEKLAEWSCPVSVDTWKLGRGSLKLSLLQSPLELRR